MVKTLPAGHPIGYGNTYTTDNACRVGLVPTGYGDGYRRGPLNYGHVLIAGVRCPVVGRVSMEKTVVLLDGADEARARSNLPLVETGDEVVLVGQQGDETLTLEDLADASGTNNYEVLTSMLPRAGRHFVNTVDSE